MSAQLYPDAPGWKGTDTSQQAAEHVQVKVSRLRAMVLTQLRLHGPSTADEIAEYLSLSVLTIRPRVSELKRSGYVHDTGERRANKSGRRAAVMEAR